MKKLLCLLCAFLLVLASCSSDDDNSSDSVTLILPKTIKDSSFPPDFATSTFVYNGNKIVSIKVGKERTDYTYDGDLIIKRNTYKLQNGKDVMTHENSYTYTNNKLATRYFATGFSTQFPLGQIRRKSVYTYNSDGTVKAESYFIDPTTGEEKSTFVDVCTFVNGNLVKAVETTTDGSDSVFTTVYEYDSKNNPFQNITGFNQLDNGIANNRIKETSSFVYGGTINGPDTYKMEYVYDANGYPTKKTIYAKDGTTVEKILEYTY